MRHSMKPVLGSGLLLCLALSALACASSVGNQATATPGHDEKHKKEKEEDAIPVRAAKARIEPLSSLYSTSATLRADKQATITARTQGVVRQLLVEEGDLVVENQPLAQLEDDEQKIVWEQARLSRDTTKRDYDRTRQLHDQGLISDEEFESTRREAEQAEQEAALAELNLSRTLIRSPFSGIILLRHLDVGATVSDGIPVYDIADLDPLYADVTVPERHVTRLKVNQTVRLFADATRVPISARIERIAPPVDPGTGTVKVTLAVEGDSPLRPGAFVRVNIVTDTHPDALVVPRSALVAEGRRWHLFRLDDQEQTVEQLEVKIGYEEGELVEILEVIDAETGLKSGNAVVSEGASALTDGARVRVTEAEGLATDGEPVVTP